MYLYIPFIQSSVEGHLKLGQFKIGDEVLLQASGDEQEGSKLVTEKRWAQEWGREGKVAE